MTTYTVHVGPEIAKQFTSPLTDEAANGIHIDDLGDGRIRFGGEALKWFRKLSEDTDGVVAEADDGLRMWVGGLDYAVNAEGAEPMVTFPSYSPEDDAYHVAVALDDESTYDVREVIDTETGDEIDAITLGQRLAAERGYRYVAEWKPGF